MKSILITVIALMASAFSVCASPQTPIKKLEKLVEKVEKKHASYDEEDWKEIAKEYAEIKKEFEEYEYTKQELKEIGKLKGRLKGYITKKSLKKWGKNVEDFTNELGGSIEGFLESLK